MRWPRTSYSTPKFNNHCHLPREWHILGQYKVDGLQLIKYSIFIRFSRKVSNNNSQTNHLFLDFKSADDGIRREELVMPGDGGTRRYIIRTQNGNISKSLNQRL